MTNELHLERSYDEPYPVDYEGRQGKHYFGKLPVIKVEELPEQARRNAQIMNRMLRDKWEHLDPRAPRGQIAWQCLRVRCLAFQMTQNQYLAASALPDKASKTLKSAEEGHARDYIYAQLLQEWPQIAEAIGDDSVMTVMEQAREEISTLLVKHHRKSVSRLLKRLAFKHGDIAPEVQKTTMRARLERDVIGNPHENYAIVRKFVLSERHERGIDEKELQPPTDADVWNHPYMHEFREMHMADRLHVLHQRGRKRGPVQQLSEYLKLLMVPVMPSISSHAMKSTFPSISQRNASDMMRNNLTDPSAAEVIVDELVRQSIIPPAVRDRLVDVWNDAWKERGDSDIPIGRRWIDALHERGMTDLMLGHIFDHEGENQTIDTRSKILDASIMDPKVPMYAVSSFIHDDSKSVLQSMERMFSEHRTRPYNRGKSFSHAYRTMNMYGITPNDLPEEFKNVTYERYEREGATEPTAQFFNAAHEVGQRKAATYIGRYVNMYDPRTIRDAGIWLPRKEKERTELARRAHITPERVNALARSQEVPPLAKLQSIVDAANAHWNDELEIDWHLSQGKIAEGPNTFARAVNCVIARYGDKGIDAYRTHFRSEAEAPFSENVFRRVVTDAQQGARLDSQQYVRLLAGLDIQKKSPEETFLQCVRRKHTVTAALDEWSARMIREKREYLIRDLVDLQEYIAFRDTQTESFDSAMRHKAWLNEHRSTAAWPKIPMPRPLKKQLDVLRMLPGVSCEDLRTWQAPIMPGSQKMPRNFEKELRLQWNVGKHSAAALCSLQLIDPALPTNALPRSEQKQLILSARLELGLPIHIEGDRQHEHDDTDDLPATVDDGIDEEEEWEAEVDRAFFKTHRNAQASEQTLAQKVKALLGM